jgi:hypothetical protein
MKVIFFTVENVLNFPESDAEAPSGRKGIAEARVRQLKNISTSAGAKLVLIGEWRKDWDFDDTKCTKDGIYLNKKLERRGMHILDKTNDNMTDKEGIENWLARHPNVTDSCTITDINKIEWVEW